MHRAIGALALLLALVVAGVSSGYGIAPAAARAQSAITIVSEEPRNDFPTGVTFTLSFTSPAPAKEVRLRYKLAPDGTGASAVAECTTAATTNCTFSLTSGRGIYIIPGAEITYSWDITDSSGARTSTPERKYVHEDTRFTFRTKTSGNVTLYYHTGSDAQAEAVLQATVDTLANVGKLEQTQVAFPVKVFLYATAAEMQPAIAPGGQGRGVSVLGEVVYSDTAMVSADVATLDITRHEVAHIVTREATKGPFEMPGWMNEGISVFSQQRPLAGHQEALDAAIRRDQVLSMKDLASSASGATGATVGVYYGQAGSIVKFLVDTYGAEKLAQLLKTFKSGSTVDKAFSATYGLDSLGVENAWRGSVGLPPRSASAATAAATPGATTQARGASTPVPAATPADTASGSGGTSTVTIAIIAALAALVVAALAGAVLVVRSRV